VFGCVALVGIAVGFSTIGIGPGFVGGDDGERTDAADGYPLRITRPYVIQDLPSRPGAIAGLLQSDESWLAVSPHGHLWELADDDDRFDVQPALSDDGRVLAYLQTSDDGFGEYVIRDLVSGVLTAFPYVSSSATDSDAPFWADPQQPAFVSPDGEQVLVHGARAIGPGADALVLDADGDVKELFVKGPAYPAGWLPDGRIAWLGLPDGYVEPTRAPEIIVTTDTGEELGRAALELTEPMELSQWSASVSRDAGFMALTQEVDGLQGVVVRVALPSGRQVERSDVIPDAMLGSCQASWRGEQALVPTATGDESTELSGLALVDSGVAAVVLADPRLQVGCSMWATEALEGDVERGLSGRVFGTSQTWWSWRWREVTAAVLLVIGAVGLAWPRRRRTSETPDSA